MEFAVSKIEEGFDRTPRPVVWAVESSFIDEDGPHCRAIGFFSNEEKAKEWAGWATRIANEEFTVEFNRRQGEMSRAYLDTLSWLQRRLGITEVAHRTKFFAKPVELDKLAVGGGLP